MVMFFLLIAVRENEEKNSFFFLSHIRSCNSIIHAGTSLHFAIVPLTLFFF